MIVGIDPGVTGALALHDGHTIAAEAADDAACRLRVLQHTHTHSSLSTNQQKETTP